ncbi:NAC domain-containing 35 [Olea europaea subsp. europaea]|uniref:NAC domain-containing 35 n=1 Tax=Olea europaea subsp. europaea TaxID=158383 RepID=A0A8S0SFI6_OLEEU|nr:NAC domain-containing 35 [Olea europaea subsp. europaea]
MAIAAAMNNQDESKDEHEHDMVMPGFRFHPTEEELVEFYLRRKVEGKRFNVELITFLDLYRYDPWELPALAAIGEKEWYFYVPRDKKYRNGDRPNRVTTSGYWKATGADRMIRSENFRSIGLKKTLVFYSGKAPKGIRTSWIMNEYRLPHHETERLQKAEISLCRVYKRAGVEDHPSLPRSLPTRGSSSRGTQSTLKKQQEMTNHAMERFQAYGVSSQQTDEKMSETSASSSTADIGTSLPLSKHNSYNVNPLVPMSTSIPTPNSMELDNRMMQLHGSKQTCSSSLAPNCSTLLIASSSSHNNAIDDLHKLVNYSQQASINREPNHQQYPNNVPDLLSHFSTLQSQQPQSLNMIPGSFQASLSDRLWDWNAIQEANKEYNPFK